MSAVEHRRAAAPEFVQHLWSEAHEAIDRAERQMALFFTGLADKGHVTQEEAAQALTATVRQLRQRRRQLTRSVNDRLAEMWRALHVPTSAEVEALVERVAVARARVERLSKAVGEGR